MLERINTPCPGCGGRSLMVGQGGYIICSYLECKAPTLADDVLSKYDELRRRKLLIDGESRDIARALAHFTPEKEPALVAPREEEANNA